MLISELGRGGETLLISVTEPDKIMSVTGPASRAHWHTALLSRALTSIISTCSYQNTVFLSLISQERLGNTVFLAPVDHSGNPLD